MPFAALASTELLHIPVAADGAPLGAQQKKFNTLIERIAAQRELLAQSVKRQGEVSAELAQLEEDWLMLQDEIDTIDSMDEA